MGRRRGENGSLQNNEYESYELLICQEGSETGPRGRTRRLLRYFLAGVVGKTRERQDAVGLPTLDVRDAARFREEEKRCEWYAPEREPSLGSWVQEPTAHFAWPQRKLHSSRDDDKIYGR